MSSCDAAEWLASIVEVGEDAAFPVTQGNAALAARMRGLIVRQALSVLF